MCIISHSKIRDTVVLVNSLSHGISNEKRINRTLNLLKIATPMTNNEIETAKEFIANMLFNFQ